jgi:hypothetical protein
MALSLSTVERFVPLAARLGVSEVARGPRGFVQAYRRAGGNLDRMSPEWVAKREAFIERHMAQVQMRGEKLFKDGLPTRRHLALIMWAYSPAPSKLKAPPKENPVTLRHPGDGKRHADFFEGESVGVFAGGDWRQHTAQEIALSIYRGQDALNPSGELTYEELFEVLAALELADTVNKKGIQDVFEKLLAEGLNEHLAGQLVSHTNDDVLQVKGLEDIARYGLELVLKNLASFMKPEFDGLDGEVDLDQYRDTVETRARRHARQLARGAGYSEEAISAAWDAAMEGGDDLWRFDVGADVEDPFFEDSVKVHKDVDYEIMRKDVLEGMKFDIELFTLLEDDVWDTLTVEHYADEHRSVEGVLENKDGSLYLKYQETFRVAAGDFDEDAWLGYCADEAESEIDEDDERAGTEDLDPPSPDDKAFWAWFGNSVVTYEDDGQPKVCFHGSKHGGFTVFSKRKIDAHHAGFFFASKLAVSRTYTHSTEDPLFDHRRRTDPNTYETAPSPKAGIYRVYLRIEKPLVVDANGSQWNRIKFRVGDSVIQVVDLARELVQVFTWMFSEAEWRTFARGNIMNAGSALLEMFVEARRPGAFDKARETKSRPFEVLAEACTDEDLLAFVTWVHDALLAAQAAGPVYDVPPKRIPMPPINGVDLFMDTAMPRLAEILWNMKPDNSVLQESVDHLVVLRHEDGTKKSLAELQKEQQAIRWQTYPTISKANKFSTSIWPSFGNLTVSQDQETTKTDKLAHYAKDNGYDGLIVKNVHDSGDEGDGDPEGTVYVVFDPNQVKSVYNRGTWSREDNDIRHNPGRRRRST